MLRLLRPTGRFIKTISNDPIQSKWMGTAATATYEQALLNVPPTRITVLDNGLRVATEDSDSPTSTVGLFINTGSRFESETNNGVGYFFERLAFKGTKKRTQTDLELEVENIGAQLNAYTTREKTSFQMKCLSNDVPKAVEILSDIIQNSKLGEAEIEKERESILRDIEEIDLRTVVFDYLHSIAFQGTPLGYSVYGPTRNIKSLKRQDLVDYVTRHYKAPRIVLAGAGGVDHEALVNLAKSNFGSLPVKYEGEAPREDHCRFTGSDVRARDDSLPLAHMAIAVEGVGWSDPDNIPLMIASTIFGSWDKSQGGGAHNASIVAQAAFVENCCHSFQSFNINYKTTGLWGIYFVCERLSIETFVYHLQKEWIRVCTSATDFEVERAKNILRTNLFLQLDGTTPVCEDIGKQVLFGGRRIPLHELDAQIEAITAADIREACYKHIYDKCPAVAAVGPVENMPDYNEIRSNMYSLLI